MIARKVIHSTMAAVSLLLLPAGVQAVQRFSGSTVVIDRPVQDDLVAAGQNVKLSADVQGDVAVAGADVNLEREVRGYVMAAGRNIEINGPVRNDLWAAGETIMVNSPVGDNAMLVGRRVELHSNSAVRGDARIAADTVLVESPVERDLEIAARSARLSANVGGSVHARVQRLTVLPNTVIRGDLTVSGPYAPEISPAAKILGKVHFNQIAARSPWSWLWWWIISATTLLVLGLTALLFSPSWATHVADTIRLRPGASALTGLLGMLLLPILFGLLLVTVIGIPLAIVLFALYLVAILLSGVFVAYLVGTWIFNALHRQNASRWLRMIAGVFLVSLLISLPWIGGIAQLIVLLLGFGALVLERRHSRDRSPPAAVTA